MWRQKVPALTQIADGGQIANDSDPGALTFLDTTINGGVSGHPKGIKVEDETGAAVNLSTYQYITSQSVYAWMKLTGGGSALAVRATVTAYFSYKRSTTISASEVADTFQEHCHHFKCHLTNVPTGTYVLQQVLRSGEAIPANLAQNIYNELQPLQWRLRHQIFQIGANSTTVPTLILPGCNKINLSGGLSDWTTMNAVPENVTINFRRTGDGRLSAEHTISCGPVNHLEPGYLVQLFSLFSNRDLGKIDANQRLSGSSASSQVDLSASIAVENSTADAAISSVQNQVGLDTIDTTRSLFIQHDATTAQVLVSQRKTSDGTVYTNGIIAPQYTGAGAPGSSTLATSAYYRAQDRYWDTTNKQEYVCTTAGDKTASVWALSGGGSGGAVQQFKIVSDGGDWWVCKPYDGTTVSSLTYCVIKPFKLRAGAAAIASEVIRSVTYSYSYAATTVSGTTIYYTRSVSGSDGSSESQLLIPDPISNVDVIYALPCTTHIPVAAPTSVLTANLVNPGTGGTYAANDILTVPGGTYTSQCTIKVLTVSAGKIATFQINAAGNYTANPSLTNVAVTGGGGSGALFNLVMAPQYLDLNVDGRYWAK